MDVDRSLLDDYETAMKSIVTEIREAQSLNVNLETLIGKLGTIHQAYVTAGKALLRTSEKTKETLKAIEGLHLDTIEERNRSHYESHQRALHALSANVQDAVHEQQRLGLEMLQISSTNQREFAAFTNLAAERDAAARDRETHLLERLDALTLSAAQATSDLSAKVNRLELIVVAGIVLIILVSGILQIV